MKRVVLHIDRVVLRGVPKERSRELSESLRATLAKEFARPQVMSEVMQRREAFSGQLGSLALPSSDRPIAVGGIPGSKAARTRE